MESHQENLYVCINGSDLRTPSISLNLFQSEATATHQFFVSNVGLLKDVVRSPLFMVRNLQWRIMVMPNELGLSFYVECIGRNNSPNWSCNATIELRLLTNVPGVEPFVRGPISHLFKEEENDFGYKYFIKWQKLLHMANDYIICKGILLEAQVIADIPQHLED